MSHQRIHRRVLTYLVVVLALIAALAWAETQGLSRNWIGPVFLFATVMIYALIGIAGRTTQADEYYVAGRRIPAFYNGMATAADWMSAASFISLAGALYLQGFSGAGGQPGGLAYVMGWTGGFCLVALLIAPKLRQLRIYTLPDYFQLRYGGAWPRRIAAVSAILCSFIYVVAQIYGVGLIASRLTGVQFEIGILLGLGGVLLCSFLGGMKAITWTQVAQYIVMLLAFMLPVSWLAYQQLHTPVAPIAYGTQLGKIAVREEALIQDPAEQAVRQEHLRRAQQYEARLQDVGRSLEIERQTLKNRLQQIKSQGGDIQQLIQARRDLLQLPSDVSAAREQWTRAMHENYERAKILSGAPRHSQAFDGDPKGSASERQQFESSRLNFLALIFCLMLGTASLPHLLTRYYTTSSVAEARSSVAWSLFFISLLYLSAPALAVLVKYEVMHHLVGSPFSDLPHWIAQWARVDPSLIAVQDINHDGLLQWGEIKLGADMIMLASPELAGLPFVVSGLVAAGGLAAALSTADGLLLTISNAVVHDLHWGHGGPSRSTERRVIVSKFALLTVAVLAALVAASKPAEILALVTASFSLAASAFFPAMVLGILWRRVTRQAAVAGMVVGLAITTFYLVINSAAWRAWLGWDSHMGLWFGIHPLSAAVFAVPCGALVIILWSLLQKRALQAM